MSDEYKKVESILSNALGSDHELRPEAKTAMDERVNNIIYTLKNMQNEGKAADKLNFLDKIKLGFFSSRKRKLATLVIGLFLLIPILGMVMLLYTNEQGPIFRRSESIKYAQADFSAVSINGDGVSSDSEFILKTEHEYSEEEIKEKLVISPSVDFQVVEASEGYKIIPSTNLQRNLLYTVKFKDKELDLDWDFRVEPGFSVLSHSPSDLSAPLNSVIEFNFNYADIDIESVKDAFKSSPVINIKSIEQEGRTVILIPENPLLINMYYSIFLNNTTKRLNGEFLASPYTGYISTNDSTQIDNYPPSIYFANVTNNNENILREDGKIFFSVSNFKPNTKGTITIYKFRKDKFLEMTKEFFSYRSAYQTYRPASKYLEQIKTEEFKPSSDAVATAPKVEKGEMLYVEASYQGVIRGAMYTPTGMLSHMTDMQNEFVLNIFDPNGKILPEGTADIIYRDKDNQIQSKAFPISGITRIDKSQLPGKEDILGAVISADGDKQLLSMTSNYVYSGSSYDYSSYYESDAQYKQNVFSYFMMDKPVYTEGDKVSFKTIFRYSEDFTNFRVHDVSGLEYRYLSGSNIIKKAKPEYNKEFGYITGEFNIEFGENYSESGTIQILRGDRIIAQKDFPVRQYVKPQYTVGIEATDSSKIYHPGDEVEFRISVTDLAGNPLAGGEVETEFGYTEIYRSSSFDYDFRQASNYLSSSVESKTIKLDSGGYANLKYKIGIPALEETTDFFSAVLQISINKHSTKSLGVIASLGDLTVFAEDTNNQYWKLSGEETKVRIKTVDAQSFKGISTNINKLEIERHWSEKIPYTYYNPETRTNGTSYEYIPHKEVIDTQYNLRTDENGDIEVVKKYDLEGSYNFKFEFSDRNKRTVKYQTHVFTVYASDGDLNNAFNNMRPSITLDKKEYKVGDKVNVRIDFPDEYIDGREAYIFLYKDRIYKEEKISIDKKAYTYTYDLTKELSPQAGIRLIYTLPVSEYGSEFKDQKYRVVEAQEAQITVRRDEDLLKVEILNDKKVFKPGEDVKLKVKVTDENGRSVSGANLNVRVFDKALLAVIDKDSFRKDIYSKVFGVYRRVGNLFTFPKAPYWGDGGDGGQGPDGIRRNFDDVATFQSTLVTDSSGAAEIAFTLPESITTWIVDVDAFTKKLNVGNSFTEIKTNKDIIVNATFPETVRVGDKMMPKVVIYNYSEAEIVGKLAVTSGDGLELKENNQDVKIAPKASGIYSFQAEAKPSKNNSSLLTVKLLGKDGKVIDGIEKSVELRSSGHPVTQIFSNKLISGENEVKFSLKGQADKATGSVLISPDSYRFSFYKKDYVINSTEERASAIVHNTALYNNYHKGQGVIAIGKDTLMEQIAQSLSSITEFQNEDGGFGMFSYSSSDIENSAYMAYTIGRAARSGITVNEIDREKLISYLIGQLTNSDGQENNQTTPSDKILAVWALSYLDPSRALSYSQAIKGQLSKNQTVAELSMLADALYTSGSRADARILTEKLLAEAKGNNLNQLYLEDKEGTYFEDKYFANIFFWKLLNELNFGAESKEKVANWFMEDSLHENAFEGSLATEMILNYGVAKGKIDADIKVLINGLEIYKGGLSQYGDNFVLSNLKEGENLIKITSNKNGLHYRLKLNEVTPEQISSTEDFVVKTEYMPLETLQPTNSLPSSQYTVVRLTVTSKKENKGYHVKTYIPAGTTASSAIPSTHNSEAYNQWRMSQNYANKWPEVSNGSLLFNGYYDAKRPTQVFEYLLVTDHRGIYGTDGTYVFYEEGAGFNGYDPGKTITIN